MSKQYLINEETLIAVANRLRQYTHSPLESTYAFPETWEEEMTTVYIYSLTNSQLLGAPLEAGKLTIHYYEEIDNYGDLRETQHSVYEATDKNLTMYGKLENNQGRVVPILGIENEQGVIGDYYFFEKTTELCGDVFDKWRKIEADEGRGENYTWESNIKHYIYTDHIITLASESDGKITPKNFPAKITEVYEAGISASGIKNANEEVY